MMVAFRKLKIIVSPLVNNKIDVFFARLRRADYNVTIIISWRIMVYKFSEICKEGGTKPMGGGDKTYGIPLN